MNIAKVNLNDTQKKKLKSAIEQGKDISLKLKPSDLQGEDIINVGKVQLKKIQKIK